MYPAVLPSSRKGPLFPPLPSDPVSDSSLHESEIISHDSSSSDDDTEKEAKRRRMLKHAESYLRGEPLYLHSARLRGPVVKNPWGKKATGRVKRKDVEGESNGGIRKRLKRYSANEDGRKIQPARAGKGKGILTSRGTNTIDDVLPEPSTPSRLRTRYSTTTNVPDRSLSGSPVSRIRSVRNRTLEFDKRDSPYDLPKQTSDEFTIHVYQTPGKKKPERSPIEVPPACSPSKFYSRPKPSQTSSSAPRGARPSRSQSKASVSTRKSSARQTSARRNIGEPEPMSDVIIVAKPTSFCQDVDLKKKRPKIDFAAKSPFVGPAPERTKQSKGKKKKISIGKENVTEVERPQPGPDLEAGSVGLVVLEKSVLEKSVLEKSVLEKSILEKSILEKSVLEKSILDKSVLNKSVLEKSLLEKSVLEKSVLEKSVLDKSVLDKSVERIEDENNDAATERVLNEWLHKHVAASQGVQLRDSASKNASAVNPPLGPAREFGYATSALTQTATAIPVSGNLATTAKMVKTAGVPAVPLGAPLRSASAAIPLGTLQTLPLPGTAAIKPPQPQPKHEKTYTPLVPSVDRNTVSHSPTRYSQHPGAHSQIQSEPAEPEPPISGAGEPLQSQAASWQNTQCQLLAAQKGFFDALQDSPAVFSPYHLNETPGRDLLRPISYFDNEPSVGETPRLGNDRMNNENMSPYKTSTDRFANLRSMGGRDAFISPFKCTFGEGGESPLGTAFTPFRAFATPESSPKRMGERSFSPLDFSPEARAQGSDDVMSTAKKSVKFGFGLLDDDEEAESTSISFGSGFSPVNFRDPGQQGEGQADDLVEQVMGFMGGGVWNIDEELKKMASGSTPGGTASTSGTGQERNKNGRGSSTRKKKLYGKRH